MKSRLVRFVILALIGFGLGAGMALMQGGDEAPTPQTATAPVEQQAAVEMPVGDSVAPSATGEITAPPAVTDLPPPTDGQPLESFVMAGVPIGGAFSLVDHKGQPVTEKSWPGKYKLVFFGFTHCPDICPAGLQKISAVMDMAGPAADSIQPLFITVDPARDTSEVMAAYLASYSNRIVGLTGAQDAINQAIDAYKVYAVKTPGADEASYMMDHSGYIYLITPDEQLVKAFPMADTAESMVALIKTTLEAPVAPAPVPVEATRPTEAAPAPAETAPAPAEGQAP